MDNDLKKIDDITDHLHILETTFRNAFTMFEKEVLDEALFSLPEYAALKKYLLVTKKNIESEENSVDILKLEHMYGICAERLMTIINSHQVRQKFTIMLERLSHPSDEVEVDEKLRSLKERAIFLKTFAEKKKFELRTLPQIKSVQLLQLDLERIKNISNFEYESEVDKEKLEKNISFYEKKIANFDDQINLIKKDIVKKKRAEEEAQRLADLEKKSPLKLPNDSLGVYRIQQGENVADILFGEAACLPLPASYEVDGFVWKKVATSIIHLLEKDVVLALKIGFKKGVHVTEKTKVSLDRLNDLAMYVMAKEKKVLLSKKIILSLEEILFT